jgi:hypothetical protein
MMATNKPAARTPKAKPAPGGDVAAFIAALEHAHVDAVAALRTIILAADARITEGIKWNAPSFRLADDFATMHLRTKQGIGLILHFGAKKTAISTSGVHIDDPHGQLEWLAKDRAIVAFRDAADVTARKQGFTTLIRAWIAHLP